MKTHALVERHIQDFGSARSLQKHWGYADRLLPCPNDPGACAYLDAVYHSHDLSMLYAFILWAVIGGVFVIWGVGRHFCPSRQTAVLPVDASNERRSSQNVCYRLTRCIASLRHHHLDRESFRPIFGRFTRLQVLILAVIAGYLAIFTFIGISYKTWVSPVEGMPGVFNTRTGLGPWADRIGVLAYALTPLSILLSSRESMLSVITGLPYQSFVFLHRWLGYVILVQSALHTLGWTIVEARLYQPQPSSWKEFIAETYIIWGVVAMTLVSFLFVFSTRWAVRLTGYEFFRKAHYIVAMLFVGACWGHWSRLSCWMIASLGVWLLDRGIRLLRMALIHWRGIGHEKASFPYKNFVARTQIFTDDIHSDIVRLDFEMDQARWKIGQHFFLCFPEISWWQAHPFTPCSWPSQFGTSQSHSYLIRAKAGETGKLARLARQKQDPACAEKTQVGITSIGVALSGPYGRSIFERKGIPNDINVLCVAGGTGITYVLPVMIDVLSNVQASSPSSRVLELIWMIRRKRDMHWISEELDRLRSATSISFKIKVFITREDAVDNQGSANTTDIRHLRKEPEIIAKEINEPDLEIDSTSTISAASPISRKKTGRHSDTSQNFVIEQSHSRNVSVPPSLTSQAHPSVTTLLDEFISRRVVCGPSRVFASGPPGLISDLRQAVASCNSAGKVWKGEERYDVTLICDNRLEL